MGRHAGWIAAGALARQQAGDAPHIILLPEVPFNQQQFLRRVKATLAESFCVVVVSEGVRLLTASRWRIRCG